MKREQKRLILILSAAVVAICLCVKYFSEVIGFLKWLILGVMGPLLVGIAIAYILNLPMRTFERFYFPRSTKKLVLKTRRPVCMLLSVLAVLLILLGVVMLVVPELISSISLLIEEIPPIAEQVYQWALGKSAELPALQEMLRDANIDLSGVLKKLLDTVAIGTGDIINSVIALLVSIFGTVTDLVMGFIFALFLLYNKEKLQNQAARCLRVSMKPAREARLYHVLRTANASFSSFIVGQCTEAVILGVLCILGMLIFRFPYAMMTGTVVGVMALIPIVGAYVGAAVGTFMIFTVDPLQAVFFLIFLIILQQIEGNLIYPKVVGSSIGLPGMWVLAAVLIGGGLGGIAGMLVGVPLAATLYKLLRETVQKREKSMQHAESESGKRPVSAAEIFGRSKKSLDEQEPAAKPDAAEQADAPQESADAGAPDSESAAVEQNAVSAQKSADQ